jgi:hypothetical protein
MKKSVVTLLATSALIAMMSFNANAASQSDSTSQAAFDACAGKNEDDKCELKQGADKTPGTCQKGQDGKVGCTPKH